MPKMSYFAGLGGSGESHKPHSAQNEFLGDTKGNRDLKTDRYAEIGGSGESHAMFSHQNEFLGATKGNKDLATDRSTGLSTGHGGGKNKAGGKNAGKGYGGM